MALTAVFLLLSSLAVGAVLGDVDPGVQQRCEYVVRELPKNLQVSMQVQYTVYSLHEGKTKIKQRLLANIREALSHGPPQMGYIEVIKPGESVLDGRKKSQPGHRRSSHDFLSSQR